MAIAANKVPGVRAAGCCDAFTARMSREHNDANVLCLGARLTGRELALEILQIWLDDGLRRRPACAPGGARSSPSSSACAASAADSRTNERGMSHLAEVDPEIAKAIRGETERQARNLELIASENFVSEAVLEAVGSVLTNKYAEGYPGQALLRRLRDRGHRRGAGHQPRQGALRRRARQRAAALGLAGQHGGLPHPAEARRHGARAQPRPRRAPHRGQPDELLGQALHDRRRTGCARIPSASTWTRCATWPGSTGPSSSSPAAPPSPAPSSSSPSARSPTRSAPRFMADIAHPARAWSRRACIPRRCPTRTS